MAGDWPLVRLGEVSDLLTGFPFKSTRYVDDSFSPRLLRGDNVGQGVLRWDGAKRWPVESAGQTTAYELREGDVIVAMDRPWIEAGLKYASVRRPDLPCLLVQRVARLRGTSRMDSRFLKYVIAGQAFTEYVLAVQTGTAVPHISGDQIKSFEFRLPSLREQSGIAHILGTLDDKIELNRRKSETLEAMARGLFRSWFVDFDPVRAKAEERETGLSDCVAELIPDRFVDSEVGEIPFGWSVVNLDQIADFLNGLALQRYPAGDGPAIPVIKIAQLRAGHTEGADLASADIDARYVVRDGDVLFSWSGSLECALWAGGPGALNQHLFRVTSDDYPKWFYYLWIHQHLAEFRRIAAGKATTMGHIQRHHLSDARVVVPTAQVLGATGQTLAPMIESQWQRRVECRTLAALRDLLLPKLISGEMRVKDADRFAQSVA